MARPRLLSATLRAAAAAACAIAISGPGLPGAEAKKPDDAPALRDNGPNQANTDLDLRRDEATEVASPEQAAAPPAAPDPGADSDEAVQQPAPSAGGPDHGDERQSLDKPGPADSPARARRRDRDEDLRDRDEDRPDRDEDRPDRDEDRSDRDEDEPDRDEGLRNRDPKPDQDERPATDKKPDRDVGRDHEERSDRDERGRKHDDKPHHGERPGRDKGLRERDLAGGKTTVPDRAGRPGNGLSGAPVQSGPSPDQASSAPAPAGPQPAPAPPASEQPAAEPPTGANPPSTLGGSRQPVSGLSDSLRRGSSPGGRSPAGASLPSNSIFGATLAATGLATGSAPAPAGTDRDRDRARRDTTEPDPSARLDDSSVVTRTVREIVKVVPGPVKAVLAAMGALIVLLAGGYALVTAHARRLGHQREELLKEVGLLQAALLPEIPAQIGLLRTTVAYRPAEGPGAGGDFYDAFALAGGRVGIVVGDVAGHGRAALAQTTLLRYTLRVYLDTGLEPRTAIKLAGRTLEEDVGAGFATAIVAVYDPGEGTLTYACAGHPPPVLLGTPAHDPVIAVSAPPIGIGAPTGLRQTTVPLPPEATACFFTDGLTEARLEQGMLGREALQKMLASLGENASAAELLARIRREAHGASDDMAACIIRPVAESFSPDVRIEELELDLFERIEPAVETFLEACGVSPDERPALVGKASSIASRWGGVLVRVRIARTATDVSLLAPHVGSNTLEAAAR